MVEGVSRTYTRLPRDESPISHATSSRTPVSVGVLRWERSCPAVETRLKAIILIVGGFNLSGRRVLFPEVEPINFAPRITAPTLMLSGKYDFFYPTETSQNPMFRMLGAAPEHKRRVEYKPAIRFHAMNLIEEVLDWLDQYLGMVVRKP